MLFHSLSGPEAHGVIDEMDRRVKSEAPAISSAIDRGDTETVGASPAGTPGGPLGGGTPGRLSPNFGITWGASFVRSCGAGPTDRPTHRSLGIRGQRSSHRSRLQGKLGAREKGFQRKF